MTGRDSCHGAAAAESFDTPGSLHVVSDLPYQAFDADNHYYEALDAFTRHVDPKLGPRCVQWCEIDGRKYHVVGGSVSHAVVNPTFDPIAKAGAMHDYFRGNPDEAAVRVPASSGSRFRRTTANRDARLAKLDEFDLEAVWLFPTLGVLYEELLKHDVGAVTLTFTAFNRWLDEDWGLQLPRPHLRGAVPHAGRHGLGDARARVGDRPGRPHRRDAAGRGVHRRRPACPVAIRGSIRSGRGCSEAGITVVAHAGDSGYS